MEATGTGRTRGRGKEETRTLGIADYIAMTGALFDWKSIGNEGVEYAKYVRLL